MVASDIAMNRGLLVAATRNAKAVAEYLKGEDSLTLVSDATTLDVVRFYREFRGRDRLIPFDKLTVSVDRTLSLTGITWVALNGPIVNETVISGSRYGGEVSLSKAASDVVVRLQAQNIEPSVAFSWKDHRRWNKGRIVDRIVSLLHWKMPVQDIANSELAGIQAFRLWSGY